MDAFYKLATIDYQLLAEQLRWGELFQHLEQKLGPRVSLLDVACGSGQFPKALQNHGQLGSCQDLAIDYVLLDPSHFSIDLARSQLRPPFEPSDEFHCTIQQFDPSASKYAVVWATHALYCVPPSEIDLGIDRMVAALESAGLGFIAHASRQSHYLHFHDLYLQTRQAESAEPFSSGEQIIEALQAKVDSAQLQFWSIDYEGRIDLGERETAEKYLQRCLFDDTIDLNDMLEDQQMGPYLRSCQDTSTATWRFPQKVWLIFFGGMSRSITDYRIP